MEIHTSIRLWATGLWGKVPILGAGCLQPVQSWKAILGADAPALRGVWSSILIFYTTQPHKRLHTTWEPCVAAALPSLCCVSDTHCLCAHLRLVSPFPCLMCFATVHVCHSVSSVLLYFFGMHGSFYSPCLHFKNAKKGSSILEQKCPRHSLSLTSSFSFKGIVWINERLFYCRN